MDLWKEEERRQGRPTISLSSLSRKRAEKELYRSAVAITEHRTIARQLEDARSENERLTEKLKSEGEKLQKLEKVMYRSSVVMYQQVDKRLESEQVSEHVLDKMGNKSHKESHERLHL